MHPADGLPVPRGWTEGDRCSPPGQPVHELFLKRARRDPAALAVRQRDRRISYGELARLASALAARLARTGAGPGAAVGVCLRRTPELIAAELAVLLSGAAFVPLDPGQPAERLRAMANDAAIEIALVDDHGAEALAGVAGTLVHAARAEGTGGAGTLIRAARAERTGGAGPAAAPGGLAYILFTSGSTGRPKGVMVGHRSLTAFVTAANQHLGNPDPYRLAAFANIGFDASVFEFFAPLACGGSVHLVPDEDRADSGRLQDFLAEHRVTHALLPPVLLPLLDPAGLPHLTGLIAGGEACDPHQVHRWAVPGRRQFRNWYGLTETTVAVAGIELDGRWTRALPLGRPLPGSRLYVLDERLAVCAPGQTGELFAGGPQIALGYVSRAGETAERFVPDPFGAPGPEGGRPMLCRTGDLARWDDDGILWFEGRRDRQVKIGGKRVEPGEIEAVLAGHPGLVQAAVDVSGPAVHAFVTPAGGPSASELREYCSARLPGHMVPALVIALDELPLTASAKVDYAALRELGRAQTALAGPSPPGPPRSGLAAAVAASWAAVLGPAGAGASPDRASPDRASPDHASPDHADPDFFDAGGDSISAMRLAAALREATGRGIDTADILAGRTISGIAERLAAGAARPDVPVPAGAGPALSPAQERLWFVEQLAPGTPVHNIVLAEQITGPLDAGALTRAFELVAARQPALRWRLHRAGARPTVTEAAAGPVEVRVTDLSALPAAGRRQAVDALLEHEARTPVPLDGGPLWRIRLARLGDGDHVLVMTIHHIVFDGWSQAVLYRELSQAYRELRGGRAAGRTAADGPAFADYTAWAADRARRYGQEDAAWWGEHLRGAPAVLELPGDEPRPDGPGFAGGRCRRTAGAAVAASVRSVAAAEGTTAGIVLLAAYAVLLGRLTGADDMVVGIPEADRSRPGLDRLIGFFIRTVPVRLRVPGDVSFGELVRGCAAEFAACSRHADAPLQRIVEAAGQHRDLRRNPLFQVMFNVYNFPAAPLRLGRAAARPLRAGPPGSHVDLTLYVIPRRDGIGLEAAYDSRIYRPQRIAELLASYAHLLGELAGQPARSVARASARPARTRLPGWRAPLPADVPAAPGLLEQVRAMTREAPDAVAIEEDGRLWSRADVLGLADATAGALRAAAVRPGAAVAIAAERTAALPGVMLGVLSAGARWALVDPELPDAVLARQLAAVAPGALVTVGPAARTRGLGIDVPLIEAGRLRAVRAAADADAPPAGRGYLSFTSGTTGEPQLVMAPEAPLVHFVNWYRAAFGIGSAARVAMLGGLAHDPLLRDLFTPLTSGGTLIVPPAELIRDPVALLAWLDRHRVTVAHLTPQLVRMLATAAGGRAPLHDLRLAAVAGDQLSYGDAAALRLIAPAARLLNFYGTTETPQAQACFEVTLPGGQDARLAMTALAGQPVPVGAGIDGAQLLVMSSSGLPAAVGELGEVVIRSRHLAAGYAGRSAKEWRFGALPGAGDGRCYRTGDLGRYLPDGNVVLAGRSDDQVKIRGFRVELGEIEAALRSHPNVAQAAVRLFGRDGAAGLQAYVVLREPSQAAHRDIRAHLRSRLPSYAVPAGLTELRSLPLTSAGKVDRARLAPPEPAGAPRIPPSGAVAGELERLVLGIWREVLGVPRIGRDDNFFDAGGHSLAMADVQARLGSALGRPVPMVDLFRFPTIRGLAGHLGRDAAGPALTDAARRGELRRARARSARQHHDG